MHRVKNHVLDLHLQANQLFDDLRAGSVDVVNRGVTRDTYGQGEQFAHELVENTPAVLA